MWSSLISPPKYWFVKRAIYKPHHYKFFFSIMSLLPTSARIFSSAPFLLTVFEILGFYEAKNLDCYTLLLPSFIYFYHEDGSGIFRNLQNYIVSPRRRSQFKHLMGSSLRAKTQILHHTKQQVKLQFLRLCYSFWFHITDGKKQIYSWMIATIRQFILKQLSLSFFPPHVYQRLLAQYPACIFNILH
jgi:hypothetical protein